MKRFLFLLLFLLILPALSFSGDESKVFIAAVGDDGKEHIDITGGSYFLKPNSIIVKVNVPVELTIRSEPSLIPHNFVLKAPEAGIDISTSISTVPKVLSFTPTKTGEYKFYCDKRFLFFKSHREHGMEGTLKVAE